MRLKSVFYAELDEMHFVFVLNYRFKVVILSIVVLSAVVNKDYFTLGCIMIMTGFEMPPSVQCYNVC